MRTSFTASELIEGHEYRIVKEFNLHTITHLRRKNLRIHSCKGTPDHGDCRRNPATAETMSEIIFHVEEAPEGGFTARALGHSVFTEADNLEELRAAVLDAVRCHFDPGTCPSIIRLHIVRDEILAA